MTSKASHPGAPQIATVPLPESVETRHCAVVGSTGSGKSTVLRQLMDHAEHRGCAAVIYDAAGDFVAHYYSPERGDVILNPFDARCSSWNPFAEIDHPADATRLASQLIPDTGSARDSVWTMAARNLLSDIFRELWSEGRHEVGDLIEAVQSKTKDDLKVWLSATASARIFAEDADRASGSVLFMMTQVANLLQFLRTPSDDRESFSFRDHFARLDQVTGAKPWIFVPRREAYFEATKPLLSCWLDCCATSILSLDPNPRRRVWVMLDELPDLPRVDQLLRLAPQGRKFGACLVLTFQAIDQMRATYGCEGAEALLGNTNTKLFLQCVDAETRAWASKTLGEVEVEVRVRSDALDFEIGQGRTSISTTRQVRPAVMESELRLAPHSGFLQLPDGRPIAKIKLTNAHIIARGEAKSNGFVPGLVEDTFWGRRSQQPSATSTLLPPEGPV
jgi:type IV secretory pathway TraG/TraD family ATPase VirD4